MSLRDYRKRLFRIWLLGFAGMVVILGWIKWQGYESGEIPRESLASDVASALLIAGGLPGFLVVRGYFRYRRWLAENRKPE